jgi:hypothetical protein
MGCNRKHDGHGSSEGTNDYLVASDYARHKREAATRQGDEETKAWDPKYSPAQTKLQIIILWFQLRNRSPQSSDVGLQF